jgi:hypothetical protein
MPHDSKCADKIHHAHTRDRNEDEQIKGEEEEEKCVNGKNMKTPPC